MKNFLSFSLLILSFICYIIVAFFNEFFTEKQLIVYSFLGIKLFLLYSLSEIRNLIKEKKS